MLSLQTQLWFLFNSLAFCLSPSFDKLLRRVLLYEHLLERPVRLKEFDVPRTTRPSAREDCKLYGFLSRKLCWYTFLLETESTPGP
jgi:hypothetical protein